MDTSNRDDLPEPETPPIAPTEDKPVSAPKLGKQQLSRGRKMFRLLLAFLIFLSLGALLVIQLLYIPLRERAFRQEAESQDLQAQLTQIASKADEIASTQGSTEQQITDLQTGQQNLKAELDQANLHNALLKARLDVARAQLALAQENATNAQAALRSTGKSLEAIGAYLDADGQKIITAQQDRLKLILSEIESDSFAAQSDLDVLANNLLEIENEYFANPVENLPSPTPTR